MKLSSRFVLDTLFLLAGGFLAVATMTWTIGSPTGSRSRSR